jgi:acyl-CoA reductase-like NAD-dependent aldehyde dehydrogenase
VFASCRDHSSFRTRSGRLPGLGDAEALGAGAGLHQVEAGGLRLGQQLQFGLVAAVFTRDLGQALRLTGRLEAGMVRVNAPTSGVDFHAPFGGAKESSYGPREQGLAARAFYTESQTVLIMP